MSLRHKPQAEQVVLIPRSHHQQHAGVDTASGFSITHGGAIGFSHDIESRMSTLSLSAAAGDAAREQKVENRDAGGAIMSNRDAYARMRITCHSVQPPAAAVGKSFYNSGSNCLFLGNEYLDEEHSDNEHPAYMQAWIGYGNDAVPIVTGFEVSDTLKYAAEHARTTADLGQKAIADKETAYYNLVNTLQWWRPKSPYKGSKPFFDIFRALSELEENHTGGDITNLKKSANSMLDKFKNVKFSEMKKRYAQHMESINYMFGNSGLKHELFIVCMWTFWRVRL
jgi:hypothetical protein